MPYKSSKQQRFFEMCRANPSKAKGKCPSRSVLEDFHKASYPKSGKRRSH